MKYDIIAGIDEAGRGPLAGPVSAAAVVLPRDFASNGAISNGAISFGSINDSKKLSPQKREAVAEFIRENALDFAVSMVGNKEIDDGDILKSTMSAMEKAVRNLSIKPDFLLIDGNYYSNKGYEFEAVVKGDAKSLSIAAASILAKVARDRWMAEVAHWEYPEYGFASHKGYGTKLHIEKIKFYGPCPYHRMTFLTRILRNDI